MLTRRAAVILLYQIISYFLPVLTAWLPSGLPDSSSSSSSSACSDFLTLPLQHLLPSLWRFLKGFCGLFSFCTRNQGECSLSPLPGLHTVRTFRNFVCLVASVVVWGGAGSFRDTVAADQKQLKRLSVSSESAAANHTLTLAALLWVHRAAVLWSYRPSAVG